MLQVPLIEQCDLCDAPAELFGLCRRCAAFQWADERPEQQIPAEPAELCQTNAH